MFVYAVFSIVTLLQYLNSFLLVLFITFCYEHAMVATQKFSGKSNDECVDLVISISPFN